MAKQPNYLMIGGIGIGALLLFSKLKSTGTSANSSYKATLPGSALSTSSGYVDATGHRVTRQPTASENAGLSNPRYILSPENLNDYRNNYLDIKQGVDDYWIQRFGSLNAALQNHWENYGASQNRTFIPLYTPSTAPFVPPPENQSSSGGGSWVGTALKIATGIISLIGVDDQALNDGETEVLLTGSAVIYDILPMFDDPLTDKIYNKMQILIPQYTGNGN